MPLKLKALSACSVADHLKEKDHNEDKQVNGGSWFYINRDGFPMTTPTWECMWRYASKLHPDGTAIENDIRRYTSLPEIPMPQAPLNLPTSTCIPDRLNAVQKYLRQLQYNHTGTQFFDVKKDRPFCGLMDCARDIIRESLPIKCLEAVVVSIYLTNYYPGLDRFPISFRSVCHDHAHRHVVLGVHYNGKYGTLGLSRREDLMYKSLTFNSLSQLISDFNDCYKRYGHVLKKVKIGMCAPHDPHTYQSMQWGTFTMDLPKVTREEWSKDIDKFARSLKKHASSRYQSAPCEFIPKPPSSSIDKRRKKRVTSLDVSKPVKVDSKHV